MKYKGMTVNEALYESGFINDFDKAVKEKDSSKVREILFELGLKESSIIPILRQHKLG